MKRLALMLKVSLACTTTTWSKHCRNLQEARVTAATERMKTRPPLLKEACQRKRWWGAKKERRQLWPAIQPLLSFSCLTHHAQLITGIHSTVCLQRQHQNHNHCSQHCLKRDFLLQNCQPLFILSLFFSSVLPSNPEALLFFFFSSLK